MIKGKSVIKSLSNLACDNVNTWPVLIFKDQRSNPCKASVEFAILHIIGFCIQPFEEDELRRTWKVITNMRKCVVVTLPRYEYRVFFLKCSIFKRILCLYTTLENYILGLSERSEVFWLFVCLCNSVPLALSAIFYVQILVCKPNLDTLYHLRVTRARFGWEGVKMLDVDSFAIHGLCSKWRHLVRFSLMNRYFNSHFSHGR